MTDGCPRALTLVAAVGSGLVAGVFLAFSTFVMAALRSLGGKEGMSAMQAVNRAAPTPVFMVALLGTALTCAGLGISALTRLDEPGAVLQAVGSTLYLAGIVVTVAYHVPRNDALATVTPSSAGAGDAWTQYVSSWTAWNHVRTLTSLAAAVTLVLALGVE